MPTWNPSLATGNATIDEQHQELFARADALIDAMLQGRAAAEIAGLVGFLRDYCRDHFALEERLMAQAAYPLAAGHAQAHRYFEQRFQEIVGALDQRGANARVVLDLKDLLRGWLVSHIGAVDAKLAAFLRGARAA
ncbi:MAG TPA: bacteriohemerythrin [Anaeromyxobacter sp.]|nr:bacteriohemerythrin [Anaeromyxobacter sp.]